MGKREPKITQSGFFNVDKPSGIVSSTVVNKLKWLTGLPCGHMGTLDPLASGVLPVGAGNATRLFQGWKTCINLLHGINRMDETTHRNVRTLT